MDSKDMDGRTPLSWAAGSGRSEIVKLLLGQKGVDINSKDSKGGQTPLSWAEENRYPDVIKLLKVATQSS